MRPCGLALAGDSASPGGPRSYGTDEAGTRGFYRANQFDTLRSMPSYGKRDAFVVATDFLGFTSQGSFGFLYDVSNGSFAAQASDVVQRQGIVRFTTASSAVGCAGIRAAANDIVFGSGRLAWRNEFRLNNLGSGTERTTTRTGFGEMSINTLPVDGAYMRYVDNANGGKWLAVNVANSVESTADTGVLADATTYHCYEVEVDATATQARYWIDGVLVATIVGGLPAASIARSTDAGFRTCKSIGTTPHTTDMDYAAYRWDYATPW